jgi:hypothetical protein
MGNTSASLPQKIILPTYGRLPIAALPLIPGRLLF